MSLFGHNSNSFRFCIKVRSNFLFDNWLEFLFVISFRCYDSLFIRFRWQLDKQTNRHHQLKTKTKVKRSNFMLLLRRIETVFDKWFSCSCWTRYRSHELNMSCRERRKVILYLPKLNEKIDSNYVKKDTISDMAASLIN